MTLGFRGSTGFCFLRGFFGLTRNPLTNLGGDTFSPVDTKLATKI